MHVSLSALIIVPALAVAAPLLASLVGRVVKVPLVVFEILLGLIIGPSVLGIVPKSDFIDTVANFGLAFLFFMAGNEIDFSAVKGKPAAMAVVGWVASLAIGIFVGISVAPNPTAGIIIGIALTSTALGTILPVLRDARDLKSPFGLAVTAVGAVGEFGPLIAISLFLSGRSPGSAAAVLVGFVVISGLAVFAASRGLHLRFHRLIAATLHTSGQFAVRFVIMIVAALVGLSLALGLDMLLGAFAAGVISRVLLSGARKEDAHHIESKLEAVSFGFLVPFFFINVGISFNLDALLSNTRALILVPILLGLLLVIRGLPGILAAPKGSSRKDKGALALFTATGLPIIVAVTSIGVQQKYLEVGTASALVGAGMLSVLVFPLLALLLRRRSRAAEMRAGDAQEAATQDAGEADEVPIEG
ncbi:MAG: cation:proton antiporter [Microbacteriaceae bacterium]|nr:cation:proton antiporter [Microbacteriaceae bacterium]